MEDIDGVEVFFQGEGGTGGGVRCGMRGGRGLL